MSCVHLSSSHVTLLFGLAALFKFDLANVEVGSQPKYSFVKHILSIKIQFFGGSNISI